VISGPAAKTAGLRARASSVQATVRGSTVAAGARRARELDLASGALVLAAQQLTCTLPLLIVLAAVRPAATDSNFGAQLSHYLGLSAGATERLTSVFASTAQVRQATTVVGLLLLVIFALGVAQAHQHFYELTWKLGARRQRSWYRQLRWIGGLLAYVVALGATARALGNAAIARPAFIALCAPISAVFYWWGQRTLLAGRVPSRSLIPGAVITGVALTVVLATTPWWVSSQVTSTVHQFGLIGVTFVLAVWQLVLSTIVLAGTLTGAAIVHHSRDAAARAP
jgi:membrane protein